MFLEVNSFTKNELFLSCMAALQRVQSKRCVREARCGRREAPVEEGEHQEDDPHQPQQEPDGGMGHHHYKKSVDP